MTVEIPVPEGPPCDFCADWPAVGSLMNLADYTTQKFCADCGPEFLLGIVSAITGADVTAAADQAPAGADERGVSVVSAPAGHQPDAAPDDDAEGSAADHWASTKRVVRSTHGHRKRAGNGDDTGVTETAP